MRKQVMFYPLSRFAAAPPERGSRSGSRRQVPDAGACVRFNAGVSLATHSFPSRERGRGKIQWKWAKRRNYPLSRFAAAPPERGSGSGGWRPVSEAGACVRFNAGVSLATHSFPSRERGRGMIKWTKRRNYPLSRFAAAPPERGSWSNGWRRRLAWRTRLSHRRCFLCYTSPSLPGRGPGGGYFPVTAEALAQAGWRRWRFQVDPLVSFRASGTLVVGLGRPPQALRASSPCKGERGVRIGTAPVRTPTSIPLPAFSSCYPLPFREGVRGRVKASRFGHRCSGCRHWRWLRINLLSRFATAPPSRGSGTVSYSRWWMQAAVSSQPSGLTERRSVRRLRRSRCWFFFSGYPSGGLGEGSQIGTGAQETFPWQNRNRLSTLNATFSAVCKRHK
ncbi:hypothetical protein Rmar_1134 [Rhodothermus marinus DSM 4252]|uniref:Uncharacterized protein n=1 Tax=Rhodothermus marinus (strain ATCC 43812 / DSM 4252 / R-10) TaxID=518766 RepID=D0MHR7_RHOM4|nr:hypothetical protein Rmar_1134 [Rhodothermus marinus DSM 4252]